MSKSGVKDFLSLIKFSHTVFALPFAAIGFLAGLVGHRQDRSIELTQQVETRLKEGTQLRNELNELTEHLEAIVEERTRALKSSNEILEVVDENRRKLLADISHEFRTPLTVIRGEAEIALRGKAKTKAEYQETLERIMEQADQTTRLVDDLLFIARADAGEPRLKIRPLCLAIVGSITSASQTFRAASVPASSLPIRREYPTTSAARIAACLRSTGDPPQQGP